MTGYFNTTEINSALTSIGTKLTEKANIANLYPVLKKATSSSEDPTPGYVYQVLIEFSFESSDNCQHLVEYLNKRLQRPSPHGVLKTLKTVNHLVGKGSRHFRNRLRQNDEFVKNAPNFANHSSAYTGTEILENIRKLSKDILLELFRDDRIAEDSSSSPEQLHQLPAVSPSGMGSYGTSSGGKYEGFGNSPINRSSVTDKVRDLLESVMSLPDPKKQIMQLCLEDPIGDYVPLQLISDPVQSDPKKVVTTPKPHVPGRAGGGWESSSEDDNEDAALEEFTKKIDDDKAGDSEESRVIKEFCCQELGNLEILPRLRNIVNLLKYGDVQTGVFTLINILQHENDHEKLLKALLILEHLLHHGVCSPNKLQSLFVKVSERLEKSKCDEVAYKAQKISLILAAQI